MNLLTICPITTGITILTSTSNTKYINTYYFNNPKLILCQTTPTTLVIKEDKMEKNSDDYNHNLKTHKPDNEIDRIIKNIEVVENFTFYDDMELIDS